MTAFTTPAARRLPQLAMFLALLTVVGVDSASAEVVTTKNGYQVSGNVARLDSVQADPLNPPTNSSELVVLVDDELRRVFLSFYNIQNITPALDAGRPPLRIKVDQRVAETGSRVTSVGVPLKIEPFDKWGRRIFSMQTSKGPIHVVQGITMVTPKFIELRGVASQQSYVWTTKIATSSLPRDVLSQILRREAGDDHDARMRIVQLYIEAERYNDARAEVADYKKQFPDADVKNLLQLLTQESAKRLLQEIELRRDAGQPQLAMAMSKDFPTEGVAGETRLRVRDVLEKYSDSEQQGKNVLALFDKQLAALPDEKQKTELAPIREEIGAELNLFNLDRFADFVRLADDETLKPDQKLSLAVTGWLLGTGQGTENLSVAISLVEVRDLVAQYLRSTLGAEREEILKKLEGLEGSAPTYIAKLLANMKPAIATEHDEKNPPGGFELSVPGMPGEPDVKYYVQLPPEYNPYRRYPAIVTLNSGLAKPTDQLNWWAGDYDANREMRYGQASRRGYVVIAPVWLKDRQSKYEFSAREHAAVLFSLRDALSRFSIDSDRVFLTGHSIGGDAAWDIALAHPDLWAGVLPIGATVDKYINFYWPNGKLVPLYYVAGEMDGDRFSKCATILDKYLTIPKYDATIIQYQGRGHETFYDDIQNMFAWMDMHRRETLLEEFTCVAMRPWDNFFWWLELDGYPENSLTLPGAWPPIGGRKVETQAKVPGMAMVPKPNSIFIKSSATRATVYLTPDMVDFERRISIKFNTSTYPQSIQPSVSVMLEDARTRCDRLHPFWQKVTVGK